MERITIATALAPASPVEIAVGQRTIVYCKVTDQNGRPVPSAHVEV